MRRFRSWKVQDYLSARLFSYDGSAFHPPPQHFTCGHASRRATCRTCGLDIVPGALRIGSVAPATTGDFQMTAWNHVPCFRYVFSRLHPAALTSTIDFEGIDNLPPCDQLRVAEILGVDEIVAANHTDRDTQQRFLDMKDLLIIADTVHLRKLVASNYAGMDVAGLSRAVLVAVVADGLAFGRLKSCPVCGTGVPLLVGQELVCQNRPSTFGTCTHTDEHWERHGAWSLDSLNSVAPGLAQDLAALAPACPQGRALMTLPADLEALSPAVTQGSIFGALTVYLHEALWGAELHDVLERHGAQVLPLAAPPVAEEVVDSEGALVCVGVAPRGSTGLPPHLPVLDPLWVSECVSANRRPVIGESDELMWHAAPRADAKLLALRDKALHTQLPPTEASPAPELPDPEAGLERGATVVKDGTGALLSATLSRSDVATGRNSFYRLQALRLGDRAFLFRRWGRVGSPSSDHTLQEVKNEATAVKQFVSLFRRKTGNTWGEPFVAAVKHVLLDAATAVPQELRPSAVLPAPTQGLLRVLFDDVLLRRAMQDLTVDVGRLPLGALSLDTLRRGYSVLDKLDPLVKERASHKKRLALTTLSSEFFTLIPHTLSRGSTPVLDSQRKLRKQRDLLDDLGDIHTVQELRTRSELCSDTLYKELRCDIAPAAADAKEWVTRYFHNTAGSQLRGYRVADVFDLSCAADTERFAPWRSDPNRQMLWHGSRLPNWVRILRDGLRIAPPDAPKTGYFFGKGVYFADAVEKSALYCYPSVCSPGPCLLAVAEVALGTVSSKHREEYVDALPAGFHSTHAVGRTAPDPSHRVVLPTGEVIPLGALQPNPGVRTTLDHNEFIVYNTAQARLRYLVMVEPACA